MERKFYEMPLFTGLSVHHSNNKLVSQEPGDERVDRDTKPVEE